MLMGLLAKEGVLDDMRLIENRGSGVPTMIDEMKKHGLETPLFEEERGDFWTVFYNQDGKTAGEENLPDKLTDKLPDKLPDKLYVEEKILHFCLEPRSKKEIAQYLELKNLEYLTLTYIKPLLAEKKLSMTIPSKPTSIKQRYVTMQELEDNHD